MPMSSGGSRSGRLARISQSNIRPHGTSSGTLGGSANGPGGHPLTGECSSPTKKDSKHRFEIVRKLGSGTYGKVSLAYDHKFDREVAVKLIKKSAIENKADLVRIRREIRIMSALNHPNIIQIFEVFENKDKIILVMEYANGGELYDYVSKYGSLQEHEARRLFRQITSAVLYCHKHKVAHRDLKLENILLDSNNHAKIADFGLSNYFGEKTLLHTFCGSPLYASPEIINGTPYRGPEVDCWSLGILLYTLVYGSMPFDGRDFNRMVRQIKRGAYYEPDTPSTASMLIRNMLRVNPERRATIDDIASHWWLNLEENLPVIQELPENRITDHTPLTERAETMVVQELLDEADVFMEFSHLSNDTRRKIEEFRRRRKEAEAYNENCPVQPKARKTEGPPMKSDEKSLTGTEKKAEENADDPLERLKQIETRLGNISERRKTAKDKEPERKKSVVEVAPTPPSPSIPSTPSSASSRRASGAGGTGPSWRIETDSLNMLMNQVLEQMEKGPVSLNLVARMKAHPLYDSRPMVKELLESILAGQSETVQKQTSRILEQNLSQNSVQPDEAKSPTKKDGKRTPLEDRPWHSVEVGFDDENETEGSSTPSMRGSKKSLAKEGKEDAMSISAVSNVTEVTVRESSFEDMDDDERATPTPTPKDGKHGAASLEDEEEEEDEYSDSELEELAVEVDEVETGKEAGAPPPSKQPLPPPPSAAPPNLLSPAGVTHPGAPPQFLEAFDRGLFKRQSKGKYQHIIIDLYGRGLSMDDGSSPLLPRRRIGGPQPTIEHSPHLFDKARQCISAFPNRINLEDEDRKPRRKKKKDELCIVEVDVHDGHSDASSGGGPPTSRHNGSVPPRTPPPMEGEEEEEEEDEEDEEESEEESEEEEGEVFIRRPGPPVIGGRIIGTPRTIEPLRAGVHGSKFAVTVAEMEPKKFGRGPVRPVAVVGPSVESSSFDRESDYENDEIYALPGGETKEGGGGRKERESLLLEEAAQMLLEQAEEEEDDPGASWKSAAASLKRRNLERRRARNRTIAVPEEMLRAADRESERMRRATGAAPLQVQSHLHSDAADPFYSQHFAGGGLRVRLHEDSFRGRRPPGDFDISPNSRVNAAAVVRDERGKSRSYHDHSPDRPDYRASGGAFASAGATAYGTSSPAYGRKFEESSLQSWAQEPRKFEVYKTRAERDAEKNTLSHTGAAPGAVPSSAYRTSFYTESAARPSATSAYYRPKSVYEDTHGTGVYSSASAHQRPSSLYHERSTTPSTDLGGGSGDPAINDLLARYGDYSPHTGYGTRSTARRPVPGFSEADRVPYTRSRSIDRKAGMDDDVRGRLTTPDAIGTDYAYVHYHDTAINGSAGRASQPRSFASDAPKSILKNKQSAELEPRASEPTSVGPVRSVIDRLKRHLSLEKSPPTVGRAPSTGPTSRAYVAPSSIGTSGAYDEGRKRSTASSIPFNRRRTSELRIGADGSIVTNGYSDLPSATTPFRYHDDSSYPRSTVASRRDGEVTTGMDKIKSLFSRKDPVPSSTSRAYTPSGTSYPLSNVATTSTSRDPYGSTASSYRSYIGSSPSAHHGTSSITLNRYGAGYGGTDPTPRRFHYDDHHH